MSYFRRAEKVKDVRVALPKVCHPHVSRSLKRVVDAFTRKDVLAEHVLTVEAVDDPDEILTSEPVSTECTIQRILGVTAGRGMPEAIND